MTDPEKQMEVNRIRWHEKVPIHLRNRTGFYAIDAFKAGEDVLGAIEVAEIGDLHGKHVVHLQSHFGLDTLSWRGAPRSRAWISQART